MKTRIAVTMLGCLALLVHGAVGQQASPTNLKVLPKDISRADLIAKMGSYNAALGVQCTFCHAQNPDTHRTDFPSDANPHKDMARVMIRMTDDLNAKYLTQLRAGAATEHPVSCGTCHMGHEVPAAFTPPPPAPRPAGPGAGAPPPG